MLYVHVGQLCWWGALGRKALLHIPSVGKAGGLWAWWVPGFGKGGLELAQGGVVRNVMK